MSKRHRIGQDTGPAERAQALVIAKLAQGDVPDDPMFRRAPGGEMAYKSPPPKQLPFLIERVQSKSAPVPIPKSNVKVQLCYEQRTGIDGYIRLVKIGHLGGRGFFEVAKGLDGMDRLIEVDSTSRVFNGTPDPPTVVIEVPDEWPW